MLESYSAGAGVHTPVNSTHIGRERLLGVPEVCQLTGMCPVTASKAMKESGRCIRLHRRLYVLESSFFRWLKELEVSQPCR